MKYIGYEEPIWKYLKHDNIECKKYKINQFGDVLNVKTNSLIQPFIDKHGYAELILGTNDFINGKRVRKHFKVHACVFITFGNKKDVKKYLKGRKSFKAIINHKDGCKRNNYIKNLEVISQKENIAHAIEIGLKKLGIEASNFSWLTEEILNDIIELLKIRTPTNMIIEELNLTQYTDDIKALRHFINNIYCGTIMSYKGFENDFNKLNTPRPITYTDDTITFICEKIEKGYKNFQIVEMLYDLLGYDGSIQMKRRYKALVSNIRNKIHRTDISSKYNF